MRLVFLSWSLSKYNSTCTGMSTNNLFHVLLIAWVDVLIQKPLIMLVTKRICTLVYFKKTQAEQETISTQRRFAQVHTKVNNLHQLSLRQWQPNSEKLKLTSIWIVIIKKNWTCAELVL